MTEICFDHTFYFLRFLLSSPSTCFFVNFAKGNLKKSFLYCTGCYHSLFYAAFRNALLKANKNLSQVLVEVLKTTAAAEETLVLHMQSLCDSSESSHSVSLRAARDPLRPHAAGKTQLDK